VTRIELAPEVLGDFERFFDHIARFEVEDAAARTGEIVETIQILTHSPLIGRPGQGWQAGIGDWARCTWLYGVVPLRRQDRYSFVLAIRNQREAGYSRRH